MFTRHVAVVSQSQAVSTSQASLIAAAVQKQITRDFSPIWNINATVSYFAALSDVPSGYWPIIIQDQLDDPNAGGYHTDKHGQPYALVLSQGNVSVDVSHECLEMLVDPFGRRTVAGPSIKPGQGRVEYLVEVCDPCEADNLAYTVNGLPVSDFYTPHYFDPVASASVRYSYTGAITQPRQLLKQGYLSWLDPVSDAMWQAFYFGPKITFKSLGAPNASLSLREWVDTHTRLKIMDELGGKYHTGSWALPKGHAVSSAAKASSLTAQIAAAAK